MKKRSAADDVAYEDIPYKKSSKKTKIKKGFKKRLKRKTWLKMKT